MHSEINSENESLGFANFLAGLSRNRTLIFDLDNTIYDEKEFLFNGYKKISKRIAQEFGCNQDEVLKFLVNTFTRSGRHQVFNKLATQFQIRDKNFIATCLETLRDTVVFPKIEPYPYFKKFLSLRRGTPLYIITNGNSGQQRNKVASINWGDSGTTNVVYANLHLPKPSSDSYFSLRKENNLKDPIYVGDSVEDSLFARNCGMDFIEVFSQKIIKNKAI